MGRRAYRREKLKIEPGRRKPRGQRWVLSRRAVEGRLRRSRANPGFTEKELERYRRYLEAIQEGEARQRPFSSQEELSAEEARRRVYEAAKEAGAIVIPTTGEEGRGEAIREVASGERRGPGASLSSIFGLMEALRAAETPEQRASRERRRIVEDARRAVRTLGLVEECEDGLRVGIDRFEEINFDNRIGESSRYGGHRLYIDAQKAERNFAEIEYGNGTCEDPYYDPSINLVGIVGRVNWLRSKQQQRAVFFLVNDFVFIVDANTGELKLRAQRQLNEDKETYSLESISRLLTTTMAYGAEQLLRLRRGIEEGKL